MCRAKIFGITLKSYSPTIVSCYTCYTMVMDMVIRDVAAETVSTF